MIVYVAGADMHVKVRYQSHWLHLLADSEEELYRFVASHGLKPERLQPGQDVLQSKPSPFWRYDVTRAERWHSVATDAYLAGRS